MPRNTKSIVKVILLLMVVLTLGVYPQLVLSDGLGIPSIQSTPASKIFLPLVSKSGAAPPPVSGGNWPQLGRDAQRTNYTPDQVDPPYCFSWKWHESSFASRAQMIVANGRLFVGSLEGYLYARNATTGAPLWSFNAGSPIRHSAAALNGLVVFSTYAGITYALDVTTGTGRWQVNTGPSVTAPLADEAAGRVYIASATGKLTALNSANGSQIWQFDAGAPILTSPALSWDGQFVFLGNEALEAIAVNATSGALQWRKTLSGQSLSSRYPVAAANAVLYRSQPLAFFHELLYAGDDIMDQAGAVDPNWSADWAKVKPQIISQLTANPISQTLFALNPSTGNSLGVAPVLYTFGNNNIPATPVITGGVAYLPYRARHGIQTDTPTAVHVTSKYDAELGRMNLNTLDITGLTASGTFNYQFRLTSDEPAVLSMSGNILWSDNWERAGGVNISSGALIHLGGVANDYTGCGSICGIGTSNPFFPLTGVGPATPFPVAGVGEGDERSGIVIANNMLYWRVLGSGIGGLSHRSGSSCPTPVVWTSTPTSAINIQIEQPNAARPLAEYVTLDLTQAVVNPPIDLRDRLRAEISVTLQKANGEHLLPYYLERGFSQPLVWPYNSDKPAIPSIVYKAHGNAYWHDPGELLLTMAQAYPYLDTSSKNQLKSYMASEMTRYPPLQKLPYSDPNRDWLRQGVARELYAVPWRTELNNWPPVDVNISALYALWLWSKNTGDWSYAQARWNDGSAAALFNARKDNMRYYADIAGAIGYYRLAEHFNDTAAKNAGSQAAVGAMQAGLNFDAFRQRAESEYLDPRNIQTGWYAPVFFGLTPEVGLYLREQFNGQPQSYLASKEVELRWWYLTRVGTHAEEGETSFVAPNAAWSHFLAHAYIVGDAQNTLRPWLDRPWTVGDLYSLQKIVSVIHAP